MKHTIKLSEAFQIVDNCRLWLSKPVQGKVKSRGCFTPTPSSDLSVTNNSNPNKKWESVPSKLLFFRTVHINGCKRATLHLRVPSRIGKRETENDLLDLCVQGLSRSVEVKP